MQLKNTTIFTIALIISTGLLAGCGGNFRKLADGASIEEIKAHLIQGNQVYQKVSKNNGDISKGRREETAQNSQKPYAVIVSCADSRVPPEHILNAGLGELFVIRTAGNVIGDFEIGSVEYAIEHLGCNLVVIMGHTKCGAVEAALGEDSHGFIATIVDEVRSGLSETTNIREAEILNIENSMKKINISDIVKGDEISVVGGIYDISDGTFRFLDNPIQ